jgi:uncharacterized protein YjbI with pentapeptide repeats
MATTIRSPHPTVSWDAQRFPNKTFAISKALFSWEQERAVALIAGDGGRLVKGITQQLDYLILNPLARHTSASARKRAEKLNQQGASIQVLELQAFWALFEPDRTLALALLRAGPAGCGRFVQLRKNSSNPLDLSAADLSGIDVGENILDLQCVNLDGADLRSARLMGARIRQITKARMDEIALQRSDITTRLIDCSLKKANLDGSNLHSATLECCDLTGASLRGITSSKLQAPGTLFCQVNLEGSSLEQGQLRQADCRGACFRKARLSQADLSGANLQQADLREADLSAINLWGADLSGADLRGAFLSDADLSGAIVADANFEGALLAGVKLAGVDTSRARGLGCALAAAIPGGSGPNLKRLVEVVSQSDRVVFGLDLVLPNGERIQCSVMSSQGGVSMTNSAGPGTSPTYRSSAGTIDALFKDWKWRWPTAQLDRETFHASGRKCPLPAKALKQLAVAAWCEVSGLPVPTPDDLKKQKKEKEARTSAVRETMLAQLRGGKDGVAKWNQHDYIARGQAGSFRKVDLSRARLRDANLRCLDFREANFEKASLVKANLEHGSFLKARFLCAVLDQARMVRGQFSSADFQDASLVSVDARFANLNQANLKGANLRGADLSGTNLCGADFTGATLARVLLVQARFDENTRFPLGFRLPSYLRWVGTGVDPRHAATAAADSIKEN